MAGKDLFVKICCVRDSLSVLATLRPRVLPYSEKQLSPFYYVDVFFFVPLAFFLLKINRNQVLVDFYHKII